MENENRQPRPYEEIAFREEDYQRGDMHVAVVEMQDIGGPPSVEGDADCPVSTT